VSFLTDVKKKATAFDEEPFVFARMNVGWRTRTALEFRSGQRKRAAGISGIEKLVTDFAAQVRGNGLRPRARFWVSNDVRCSWKRNDPGLRERTRITIEELSKNGK
jgi:hypothetical protein